MSEEIPHISLRYFVCPHRNPVGEHETVGFISRPCGGSTAVYITP